MYKNYTNTTQSVCVSVCLSACTLQEEPEEERARLWFIAAINSTSAQLQLKAFRNAIDTLTVSIASYAHTMCSIFSVIIIVIIIAL